jgi:phospholipid transport system substrate-binding protein
MKAIMKIRNSVAVLFLLWAPLLVAQDQSPNEVVEATLQRAIAKVECCADELRNNYAALEAAVEEILGPSFDKRYSAARVMGVVAWRSATDEQKDGFVEAFNSVLVAGYGKGLLELKEDTVKVRPFDGDDSGKNAVVKTDVTLPDGKVAPVFYRMRRTKSGWKAWDVVIEGISYVTSYTDQYGPKIRQEGLDSVIAELKAEAEQKRNAPAETSAP